MRIVLRKQFLRDIVLELQLPPKGIAFMQLITNKPEDRNQQVEERMDKKQRKTNENFLKMSETTSMFLCLLQVKLTFKESSDPYR
ncbi:MAG: hypothetical protein ACEPOZ_00165 [Marinifilaceae bacterium]